MPLLSEYLNLSLKPSFSPKSNYLTISCSDVIGTETVDIGYLQRDFFPKEIGNIFVEILELYIDLLIKVTFLKL